MTILRTLVDGIAADAEMFGRAGACPTLLERGGNDRILLITGANAGGKSLVCKFIEASARRDGGLTFMRIGMGIRTAAGMHRAFMFGEEDRESTGRISLKRSSAPSAAAGSRMRPTSSASTNRISGWRRAPSTGSAKSSATSAQTCRR